MRTLTACFISVLIMAVPATPASAFSFQGVEQVEAVGAYREGATETATATCPRGKRVIGAGGSAGPSAGNPWPSVRLQGITPNPDLTAVTVSTKWIAGGLPNSSQVHAVAICALVPAANQLQRVESQSLSDSAAVKEVIATCPSGKRVTGTAAATHGSDDLAIEAISPNPALTQVTARAAEDQSGVEDAWAVTAYAICAKPTQKLALTGLVLKTDHLYHQFPYRGWHADCPKGKRLIGLGGSVEDASGQHGQIVMSSVTPQAPTNGGPPNAAFVYGGREHDGSYEWWTVTVHAICDYPPFAVGT